MTRRVLLTGAAGQLGIDIVAAAATSPAIELAAYSRAQLDITDSAAVTDAVAATQPDVIIHAGAYTAVDDCETNIDHAMLVNGAGTENVAAAAAAVDARVIYVSTDYVFDGSKVGPYVETDPPNPASVYGASKLRGEQAVGPEGLVVRTSWVCGANGSNMLKTILGLVDRFDTLTFVDDQIGKPTFTADLAATLLTLAGRDDVGIMHVTNEGTLSWYEFCREVLAIAGLDPDRVKPCATADLDPPRPAPRPANSVLDNTRFESLGLPVLRDFHLPLAEAVADLT